MCYFLFPCEKRSFTGGSNPAGIRAKAHIVIPTPSRRAFPLGLAAKHISYSTHSAREKARAEFLCFLAINYALIRAPSALRVPFQRCIVYIDICLAPTTLGSSCFAGEGISCGATEEGPEQMLLVEDRSSEGRSSLAPPPPPGSVGGSPLVQPLTRRGLLLVQGSVIPKKKKNGVGKTRVPDTNTQYTTPVFGACAHLPSTTTPTPRILLLGAFHLGRTSDERNKRAGR